MTAGKEVLALSNPRCEARSGHDTSAGSPCGRRAAFLAIGDEGETFRLCQRCAELFEGGMAEVRPLAVDRISAAGGRNGT